MNRPRRACGPLRPSARRTVGILRRSAGWALCGVAGVLTLAGAAVAVPASATPPSHHRTASAAGATGGARAEQPLALGLTSAEHSALSRAGAFGAHPVRLLILGDSVAMTLGMGLSEDAQSEYGVSVADDATIGCDLDPQLQVVTSGAVGPATQGCVGWQTTWPLLDRRASDPRWWRSGWAAGRSPTICSTDAGSTWASRMGRPPARRSGQRHRHLPLVWCQSGAVHHALHRPQSAPARRRPLAENDPARARAYNAVVEQVARSQPADGSA